MGDKKMKISLIAAISKNNVIGKQKRLPWFLPKDLQHFKNTTIGSTIIMGRNTFESIGRLLPNRFSIVISSHTQFKDNSNSIIDTDSMQTNTEKFKRVSSLAEALEYSKDQIEASQVYIIGGQRLFKDSLEIVDELILTHVDCVIEDGDSFFFPFSPEKPNQWSLVSSTNHPKDIENQYSFSISYYKKL
ncbi:dihydrofolate reductase [Tieghemostelium lacteum]|uniref:dihydrofolate reductase n=1 Tax=Tieghemostelium lacteum TaxID=361077 RepID=A0A151Z8W9_TIELA|nr:dihydrofolate reductase [Tieghemostelium lacteum]|eukprot:KYQ90386.1 dihydrofolate reductase [Tieghemostelium lacteum]